MEIKKPFYHCAYGIFGKVEMHYAIKDKKKMYLVCEYSGKKECDGCQFNLPELADIAFSPEGWE